MPARSFGSIPGSVLGGLSLLLKQPSSAALPVPANFGRLPPPPRWGSALAQEHGSPHASDRLRSLDHLRGICACGIMLYHYLTWNMGPFDAGTVLGRVGIYGVAIFYMLSGITLHHVYHQRLAFTAKDVLLFLKKRAFRILPLLWLATFLTLLIAWERPGWWPLFLNLTGLFGLIDWDGSIAVGAWSIGNELVFYLLFPLLVFSARSAKGLFALLGLGLLAAFLYFTFGRLTPERPLTAQWRDYVHPLDQAFLFLCGFLLGHSFHARRFPPLVSAGLLVGGMLLFVLYPVEGGSIRLVTGGDRLVLTLSTLLITLGGFKFTPELWRPIQVPLTHLGHLSYSVYLLHPLVHAALALALPPGPLHASTVGPELRTGISIIGTLVCSHFTYTYLETRFIRLAR